MYKNLTQILYSRKNTLITLVILGVLAHACMLTGPFKTMDDEVSIVYNEALRNFSNIPSIFTSSFFGGGAYYRPLVTFSFLLEYKLFGLDPFFYNFTNLLLHLGCGIFVFLILEMLLKSRRKMFFIAALFMIHTLHWEAVSNIAGRSILLCSLFYLAAFYFYLLYLNRRKGGVFIVCSCLAFILSLLSKESAVTLPAAILSYEVLTRRYSSALNRVLYITIKITPYFLILGIYFIIRQAFQITRVYFWNSFGEMMLGIGTFLRTVLTHLRLVFWPVDLYFDRAQEYFVNFHDPQLIMAVGCFVLFIIALIVFWRTVAVVEKFFMFWVIAGLLPVSQLVPLRAYGNYAASADHFLYLPSIGIFALIIIWIERVILMTPIKRIVSNNMLTFLATLFVVFLLGMTIRQNLHSRDELVMFSESLKYGPENTRIRTSYALALAKHRKFAEAEEEFRRVLAKEPFNTRARIGLGKSLCDQDKYWEGIQEYEKIHDPGMNRDLLEENIRLSYAILIKKYLKRLQDEPENAQLYYSLGVMYSKTGKVEEAVNEYRKAVALEPDYKEALLNLAVSLEVLGEGEEAQKYFRKMEQVP